jgi:multisubunit Na+/H+ antiporter MnhB subunit
MLTIDLGHFFILNIFNTNFKKEDPALKRSKSKIVENLELNHPYNDVSELFLCEKTLKQYPHANFVNVGLVLKLVIFTLLIGLFQSSPRVMTWLIAAIQVFSLIAILFFQARQQIFKNTFILVFRLIEELALAGIAILLVTFANDPDNMKFKSKTTEMLQTLGLIAILTLLIAELVVYLRYIFSPQKEDTEKRKKAYEEVKRINTNKKFDKEARKAYKVDADEEFGEGEGASKISNKLNIQASRKVGKKNIITKNGNSPSASQHKGSDEEDDDKSYKMKEDDIEASVSNNQLYKFKTSKQVEEDKSYKI